MRVKNRRCDKEKEKECESREVGEGNKEDIEESKSNVEKVTERDEKIYR